MGRYALKVLAMLALATLSSLALAQSCYQWRLGPFASGQYVTGATGAQAAQAYWTAYIATRNETEQACFVFGSASFPSNPAHAGAPTAAGVSISVTVNYAIHGSNLVPGTGTPCNVAFGPSSVGTTGTSEGMTCPDPEDCNESFPGVGDEWTSTSFPGADGYCHALSNCRMSVVSSVGFGGETLYTIRHTTQQCAVGQVADDEDLPPGEQCIESGGLEFCGAPSPQNCGYVNDEFTCLGAVEGDGCDVFADGSRVCGGAAPTPPVPDNGTPGVPATPTQTINVTNNTSTTTLNFYDDVVVGGSARPPGTSGDNPHDGRDDGDGAGGGLGDGDGDGEGECPEGATCDGTLPDAGELGEVCTFEECTQALWTRINDAPLFTAINAATNSWPAGSCPDTSFELWGEQLDFSTAACDMWTGIGSALGVLMLLVCGWFGVRIILSA